jgi:hypothetical protein
MMMNSGLLSNDYKKLAYRTGKRYNVANQRVRVGVIMAHANMILFLLGTSVETCVRRNMSKLTARHRSSRPSDIKGIIKP